MTVDVLVNGGRRACVPGAIECVDRIRAGCRRRGSRACRACCTSHPASSVGRRRAAVGRAGTLPGKRIAVRARQAARRDRTSRRERIPTWPEPCSHLLGSHRFGPSVTRVARAPPVPSVTPKCDYSRRDFRRRCRIGAGSRQAGSERRPSRGPSLQRASRWRGPSTARGGLMRLAGAGQPSFIQAGRVVTFSYRRPRSLCWHQPESRVAPRSARSA
jgi:hypothetical protein